MDIRERLKSHCKKTIMLPELAEYFNIKLHDTDILYAVINNLIQESIVEPVKASGTNGNKKYPMYLKYRVLIKDEVPNDIINNIGTLHPLLLRSGYLSVHPEQYEYYKDILESISGYLFKGKCRCMISRKERSFEIFGKEKVLDDRSVQSLLKNLNISEKELAFYDTPEYCFHDYIPDRKERMTLLICENKDIWFNIRKCMFENKMTEIFGVHIDGVVYGNGNKVSHKQGALREYVKFMGNPGVDFLYWGDIDREGFEIYKRTVNYNRPLSISLFVRGYQMMIKRALTDEAEDSGY